MRECCELAKSALAKIWSYNTPPLAIAPRTPHQGVNSTRPPPLNNRSILAHYVHSSDNGQYFTSYGTRSYLYSWFTLYSVPVRQKYNHPRSSKVLMGHILRFTFTSWTSSLYIRTR